MATTKALGTLLSPLPLSMLFIVGGFVLLLLGRRRGGPRVLGVGIVLLLAFSSEPFARLLLAPLESRHPPISDTASVEDVRWIVVLGAGASENASYPPTTRLSGVASLRLMEGLRLHRALPDSRLILSGGSVFGDTPSATVMSRAAVSLGADTERLLIHPDPRNTWEEMRQIRDTIGTDPFIMVTSASHMPRALFLAESRGLNPTPAATARRIDTVRKSGDPRRFLPSANALAMSERAIHEYLGILWSRVRY